jgi:uncharacterized iron-regulated membrane protein
MRVPAVRVRAVLVGLHRWVGLVTAIFLVLAGLTGALLVWYPQLDRLLAAQLHEAPAEGPALGPLQLRDRVAAVYPQAQVNYVELRVEPGRTVTFFLEPATDPASGQALPLQNDEVFVDPATGRVVGERRWGAISQGWVNLMPFVYQLHYTLALGDLGLLLMGVVALLWTVDCFVGAALTLPGAARSDARPSRGFWRRFAPSWVVRLRGGAYKLNFDLHRAGGLWTWAMLFVLAWSSVAFNLNEVYHPVMKWLLPMEDRGTAVAPRPTPQAAPGLGWQTGLDLARERARAEATRLGFTITREEAFSYDPRTATFRYRIHSSADIRDRGGSTSVYIDANDGRWRFTSLPTGQQAGSTVTHWLMTLHMANVWGLPFRVFMCVMGLAVAALSVTGVVIWWRKRRGRRAARSAAATPCGALRPGRGNDEVPASRG